MGSLERQSLFSVRLPHLVYFTYRILQKLREVETSRDTTCTWEGIYLVFDINFGSWSLETSLKDVHCTSRDITCDHLGRYSLTATLRLFCRSRNHQFRKLLRWNWKTKFAEVWSRWLLFTRAGNHKRYLCPAFWSWFSCTTTRCQPGSKQVRVDLVEEFSRCWKMSQDFFVSHFKIHFLWGRPKCLPCTLPFYRGILPKLGSIFEENRPPLKCNWQLDRRGGSTTAIRALYHCGCPDYTLEYPAIPQFTEYCITPWLRPAVPCNISISGCNQGSHSDTLFSI